MRTAENNILLKSFGIAHFNLDGYTDDNDRFFSFHDYAITVGARFRKAIPEGTFTLYPSDTYPPYSFEALSMDLDDNHLGVELLKICGLHDIETTTSALLNFGGKDVLFVGATSFVFYAR